MIDALKDAGRVRRSLGEGGFRIPDAMSLIIPIPNTSSLTNSPSPL